MRTFAEFLKPLGQRLVAAESDCLQNYVTTVRPSQQVDVLTGAAEAQSEVVVVFGPQLHRADARVASGSSTKLSRVGGNGAEFTTERGSGDTAD